MKWEINIIDFMLIIGIIIFVVLMAWKVLGSSPSIEMLGIFLGFVFLFYAVGNTYDMKEVKDKLNRLDDIYKILKERLK